MSVKKILSQKVKLFSRLMKNLSILRVAIVALVFSSPIFASPRTLILGGENGWGEISELNGVVVGERNGQFGYDALELSTFSVVTGSDTDLLLTFDEEKNVRDVAGHYSVTQNNLVYTTDSVKGGGAAMSRGVQKGITLSGSQSALFGKSGFIGSFTIEFWLCPSLAENGETVLSWRSSLNDDVRSEYQMISASFVNNHLEWTFNNIFIGFRTSEIRLAGYNTIVPQKWSRHTLTFDDETGLLEYLVDGRTESLAFITRSGHENGTVCYPVLGVKAAIELCSDYVGKIDNFRITRHSASHERSDIFATGNEKYKTSGGKIVTNPILVSQAAVFQEIETLMTVPSQTDIRFYVRSGDNCYGWTDEKPEWKEVVPGEQISDVKGMYFQLAAEFLPDGAGKNSPKLSEIVIKYEEQNEPLPPFSIVAQAGNASVTLTWSYSVDDTAGGYYVYYGNRPGEYLGKVALEGTSPVNVGDKTSVTLTGLENGRIYYFAVSAYSKIDKRINGMLSKEVFARPSSRLSSGLSKK